MKANHLSPQPSYSQEMYQGTKEYITHDNLQSLHNLRAVHEAGSCNVQELEIYNIYAKPPAVKYCSEHVSYWCFRRKCTNELDHFCLTNLLQSL